MNFKVTTIALGVLVSLTGCNRAMYEAQIGGGSQVRSVDFDYKAPVDHEMRVFAIPHDDPSAVDLEGEIVDSKGVVKTPSKERLLGKDSTIPAGLSHIFMAYLYNTKEKKVIAKTIKGSKNCPPHVEKADPTNTAPIKVELNICTVGNAVNTIIKVNQVPQDPSPKAPARQVDPDDAANGKPAGSAA